MDNKIEINLSQIKNDSKESLEWREARTSNHEYSIQQIKKLCLEILYKKYMTWKRKRFKNFGLGEPVKFSVRLNNSLYCTLMQKRYTKDDIIKEDDVLIQINKSLYLIRPFRKFIKQPKKIMSLAEIDSKDFNAQRYFHTIEYFNNMRLPNGSPVVYSSIESNRRKH